MSLIKTLWRAILAGDGGLPVGLALYPTTMEADFNALAQSDLSERERLAMQVRLGEMQTLDSYVTWFGCLVLIP